MRRSKVAWLAVTAALLVSVMLRCAVSSQRWRLTTQARSSSSAVALDPSTPDLPGQREGGVDEGGVDVVPVAQVVHARRKDDRYKALAEKYL